MSRAAAVAAAADPGRASLTIHTVQLKKTFCFVYKHFSTVMATTQVISDVLVFITLLCLQVNYTGPSNYIFYISVV
jgi:hypothetical protein